MIIFFYYHEILEYRALPYLFLYSWNPACFLAYHIYSVIARWIDGRKSIQKDEYQRLQHLQNLSNKRGDSFPVNFINTNSEANKSPNPKNSTGLLLIVVDINYVKQILANNPFYLLFGRNVVLILWYFQEEGGSFLGCNIQGNVSGDHVWGWEWEQYTFETFVLQHQ